MSERPSITAPTIRVRGLKGGHAVTTTASSSHHHHQQQHRPNSPHPRRQRHVVCFDSPCGAIDEDESYYFATTRPKGLKNVGNTCYANATLQCLLNTALSHAITDPVASAIFRRYSSNPNILAQGSGSVDLEMDGASCGGENNTTTTGTSSTISKNSLSSSRQRKLMLRERKRLEDETMYENCQWLSAELRQLTLEYHAPDVNRSSNYNSSTTSSSSSRYWMMYGGSKHADDTYVVDPGSVTRYPHRLSSSLTPYLQEDAHEFLRAFLGTLVMQGQNKELSSLFDGLLESSVTCQTCYRPSLTRDRYMDLSLDIADPHIESLSDALCEFTTTELLSGENAVFCRNCECKRAASKGLRLATAPSILVCHFKRFAYDEKQHKLVRLRKKVTFPLRLEIGDFMSKVNQARPPPYELVSVLVHQGNSCEYGHYLAYVKHSGLWYKCNDSTIEPVDVQTVLNQQAYILMYEVAEMREKNGFGSHHNRNRCNSTDYIASGMKTKNGTKYAGGSRNGKKPTKDDLLSYYTSKLWCGMDDSPLMWSELCQNYSNCWRMNDGRPSNTPSSSSSRRSGGRSARRSSSSSTSSRKKRGSGVTKDSSHHLHHSTGALHHNLCHGDDLSTLGDTTVESTDTKRRFLRSSSSGNLRDVGDHYREGNHHDGHHGRGSSTGRAHSVSARHRRQNSNQTTPGNFDSTSTKAKTASTSASAADTPSHLVTPKNRTTNAKSPHRRSMPGNGSELPPRAPINNNEGGSGSNNQQLII
jgi:Ubiquitin carboxyl-terminal hydrolase